MAPIQSESDTEFTPLGLALDWNDVESAALLLDYGASPTAPFKFHNETYTPETFRPERFQQAWAKYAAKRNNVKTAFVALYGVLRKRFIVTSPVQTRTPKDVVRIITGMVWESRCAGEWNVVTTSATKKIKTCGHECKDKAACGHACCKQ